MLVYLGASTILGALWLVGYRQHLQFGRDVLRETKDPAALKHAAEFTRGYRSANFKFLADAMGKIGRRGS